MYRAIIILTIVLFGCEPKPEYTLSKCDIRDEKAIGEWMQKSVQYGGFDGDAIFYLRRQAQAMFTTTEHCLKYDRQRIPRSEMTDYELYILDSLIQTNR